MFRHNHAIEINAMTAKLLQEAAARMESGIKHCVKEEVDRAVYNRIGQMNATAQRDEKIPRGGSMLDHDRASPPPAPTAPIEQYRKIVAEHDACEAENKKAVAGIRLLARRRAALDAAIRAGVGPQTVSLAEKIERYLTVEAE